VGVSAGDWALVILAVFWAVLVLFLALVMISVFRMLEAVKQLIDGIRTETVPLLSEVRTTVVNVNQELERVDGLMAAAGNIARSGQRLANIIEHTLGNPLVKAAAYGAGARALFGSLRGKK
jgi:uncharacterized protein YoxC